MAGGHYAEVRRRLEEQANAGDIQAKRRLGNNACTRRSLQEMKDAAQSGTDGRSRLTTSITRKKDAEIGFVASERDSRSAAGKYSKPMLYIKVLTVGRASDEV